MAIDRTIMHGIPIHKYISIVQPCYTTGGLDCCCVKEGLGEIYKLKNPYNDQVVYGELICRRSVYTDTDSFSALAYTIYGLDKDDLVNALKAKYNGMISEIVELWIFKRIEK